MEIAVERHIHGCPGGQDDLFPTRSEDTGETGDCAARRAESGARAHMSRGCADHGSGAGAHGGGSGNAPGVFAFAAFALNFAFGFIQVADGVNAIGPRAQIARDARGAERDGIIFERELGFAFDAAGGFGVRNAAVDVAALWDDEAAVDEDGDGGFEINAIAGDGGLRVDRVGEAQKDVGPGRDDVFVRAGGAAGRVRRVLCCVDEENAPALK